MPKYVIVPIVEGRGEVDAVPILLRGWLRFRRYRNVEVHADGPVFAGGKGNIAAAHDDTHERGVEHFIRIALLRRPQPDIILVLLDADDDCPMTLAGALLARARTLVPDAFPIGIVVANRKYEAWFLAAFASGGYRRALEKQGYRLKRHSLPARMDVEAIAGCEGRLEDLIDFSTDGSVAGRPARYKKTTHQRALTESLPFTRVMTRRSRSFRKLLKELHELLTIARRRRRSTAKHTSP